MFRRTPPSQSPIGPIISQIVTRLAQNPEVQRQVKKYAAEAGKMTARATIQAKQQWKQHVQPKINQMSAAGAATNAKSTSSSQKSSSSSTSQSSSSTGAKSAGSMWEQFSSAADKFKASSSQKTSSSSSKANYSSQSSSSTGSSSGSSGKQSSAWTPEMRVKAFMGRMQQKVLNIPNMLQQRAMNYWNNFNMSRDFMMVMMCLQVLSGIFGLLFHQGTDKQGAHGQARKIQEQRIAEEKAALEKKRQEDAIKNKDTLKEEMQTSTLGEAPKTNKLIQIANETTLEGSQLSYGSGGDSPITVFQQEQQNAQKKQRRGGAPGANDDDPFAGTWWVSKNPPVHNPNIGIHQREGVSNSSTSSGASPANSTPVMTPLGGNNTPIASGSTSTSGGFDTTNFQMTTVTFGESKAAHPDPAQRGYDPLPPRQAYGEAEGVKPWFGGGATQRRLNQ